MPHLPPKKLHLTGPKRRHSLIRCVGIPLTLTFLVSMWAVVFYTGWAQETLSDAGTCDGIYGNTGLTDSVTTDSFFGGGSFTFFQAKVIDVACDYVIGKALQAGMCWITTRVYMVVLNQMLERESSRVGYDFYIALAMDGGEWRKFLALGKRIFSSTRTVGLCTRVLAMFLSVIYLMAFPALFSAATAYQATATAQLTLRNGTILDLRTNAAWSRPATFDGKGNITVRAGNPEEGGKEEEEEAEFYRRPACRDVLTGSYAYGIVRPLIAPLMTLIALWAFLLYCLWEATARSSQLYQCGRRLGPYRGVLDLADAVGEELGPHTCAYSNAELENALGGEGMTLRYRQTVGNDVEAGKRMAALVLSSGTDCGVPVDLERYGDCEFGHLGDSARESCESSSSGCMVVSRDRG